MESLHGKTWWAGKEKTLRKCNLMVTFGLLTMVGAQSWESNWEMGNLGLVWALCELQDIREPPSRGDERGGKPESKFKSLKKTKQTNKKVAARRILHI